MDIGTKQELLLKAKTFFKNKIAKSINKNTEKCGSLSVFDYNPFLIQYLAQLAFGDTKPESLAKALIYPRCLGTSPATTFGNQIQFFCSDVLGSYASTTQGCDIEFVDAYDGRKKYCQMKAGPNTINRDDVKTICDHFTGVRNLARTNHLDISMNDCVVGIIYGNQSDINANYKAIDKQYPVYAGSVFWTHLTGDEVFYHDLVKSFVEAANEMSATKVMQDAIKSLTEDIKKHGI